MYASLLGVDPWMLLRVVKHEKVPEDGLGEYPQLKIAIFVHNLMKTNGSCFGDEDSSYPDERGGPDDVECALPAERLDEEGAEGEVDDQADVGPHHRSGHEAAPLLHRHPPEGRSFTYIA